MTFNSHLSCSPTAGEAQREHVSWATLPFGISHCGRTYIIEKTLKCLWVYLCVLPTIRLDLQSLIENVDSRHLMLETQVLHSMAL